MWYTFYPASYHSTQYSSTSFCRFLIDSRWFKQWKKYVGFDSWDMYNVGEHSLYPGPVDNSGLFSGNAHIHWHILHSLTPCEMLYLNLWVCQCVFFCLCCEHDSTQLVINKHSKYLFTLNTWCHNLPLLYFFSDHETQILKEHLIDELDYVLVPTEAWNKLVCWYGCLEGQRPIVRKVTLWIYF